MIRRRLCALLVVALLGTPVAAFAWDVICERAGEKCEGPFEIAQTQWEPTEHAEHMLLLLESLRVAGLPPAFTDPITLDVFTLDEQVTDDDDRTFPSVRPVPTLAERRRSRVISIPAMANLPDFSYTLWDLAAGNELCPPDPSEPDMVECHNYETHIGWLNSNHMLPQSRKWYEHLHAIALELAAGCKAQHDAVPQALRNRYRPYFLACEKQALLVEGVGHHYLQDSWSVGHLWERWGGTEEQDFGGDQALGFAVATFTGLIHGGKAVFDHTPVFEELAPWDDPMCAPHENVEYIDAGVTPVEKHPGVGDIFLFALHGDGPAATGDRFAPQRHALLGCAVDGLRAVYGATAQVHGALNSPQFSEFDTSRSVSNDSCWAQRATNAAIAEGFGVHRGEAPNATRFIPDEDAGTNPSEFTSALQPLILTQLRLAPLVAGAPLIFNPVTVGRFQWDASYAAALAITYSMVPEYRDQTNLASGGLPALAGIRPNSFYARGNPATKTPPAFYADPFPPWSLADDEDIQAPRKEVLNVFFADANAAQRCRDFQTFEIEDYVAAVDYAHENGLDSGTVDARCGQCPQMIAPHLRHGELGNYDTRREAFCALVAPTEAEFIYTDENPESFTGSEPLTFEALQKAARIRCHCEDAPTTTTVTTTTSSTTTLPPTIVISCNTGLGAHASSEAQVDASGEDRCSDSPDTVLYPPSVSDTRSCHSQITGESQSSTAQGNGNFNLNLANAVEAYPGTHHYSATGATVSIFGMGSVTNTPSSPNSFSSGGGGGGVGCQVVVNGTVNYSTTASGSFSGNGQANASFGKRGSVPFASLAVRSGVNDTNFPKSGTIGPGIYEFTVTAAGPQLYSNGSSSGNVSFSLSFTEP